MGAGGGGGGSRKSDNMHKTPSRLKYTKRVFRGHDVRFSINQHDPDVMPDSLSSANYFAMLQTKCSNLERKPNVPNIALIHHTAVAIECFIFRIFRVFRVFKRGGGGLGLFAAQGYHQGLGKTGWWHMPM